MTSCSVTRNERPVRLLCISDARRADSTLASRLRSLLLDAAIYALRTDQQYSGSNTDRRCYEPLLVLLVGPLRLYGLRWWDGALRGHFERNRTENSF